MDCRLSAISPMFTNAVVDRTYGEISYMVSVLEVPSGVLNEESQEGQGRGQDIRLAMYCTSSVPWLYALKDCATASTPCHGASVSATAVVVVEMSPLSNACSWGGLTSLSGTGISVERLIGSWRRVQ